MAIGRVNAGGGASFNVTVVGGTTQPSSPKENTVWVNTDTAITEWVFAYEQPTTRQDGTAFSGGEVWINCGNISTTPINVLKKNGAYVYPNSCYQYVSGVWVNKTVRVYRSGSWIDWTLYLYNLGEEYTSATGGWQGRGWLMSSLSGYAAVAPVVTKNAANMVYRLNGISSRCACGVVEVVNDIDITRCTTLTINYNAVITVDGSFVYLFVVNRNATYMSNWIAHVTLASGSSTNLTATIDVSNITGSYDIAIGGSIDHAGSQYYLQTTIHSVYLS